MPLKGACVTDGFWSCRYGIFAMHFSMGPQGSLSIASSSVIDQVLLVLVNLRFLLDRHNIFGAQAPHRFLCVITFVHWRSVPVCRSRQPVTVTTLNFYNMYHLLWITSARDGHHLRHYNFPQGTCACRLVMLLPLIGENNIC